MELIHNRCCGIEAFEVSAKCCVLRLMNDGRVERLQRIVRTLAGDLDELAGWLRELQVTHVGILREGMWWKPVRNALERDFEVIVSDAHLLVRTRAESIDKSEWLAELLQRGLLVGITLSRVDRETNELRDYRDHLLASRHSVVRWIKELLVESNIRLASVTSDLLGRSGQAIITAILEGRYQSDELAELAKGRLRAKIPQLRLMVTTNITDHERFLLREWLDLWRDLGRRIAAVDKQMQQRVGTARKTSMRSTRNQSNEGRFARN